MKPAQRSAGRGRTQQQQGFTLLELLLAFVIFSMVIAIFSQAVFQISLFARASARAAAQWQQRWATGFALDDPFRSLVLPAVDAKATTGSASSFSSAWTDSVGSTAGRPRRFTLSLRALPAEQTPPRWGLYLKQADEDEALVAQWDYPVSFRFRDSQGQLQITWPKPLQSSADIRHESLPRAVWVVDERDAVAHVWTFDGLTQPGLAPRRSGAAPASGVSRP